jgi:hypothetical protein
MEKPLLEDPNRRRDDDLLDHRHHPERGRWASHPASLRTCEHLGDKRS